MEQLTHFVSRRAIDLMVASTTFLVACGSDGEQVGFKQPQVSELDASRFLGRASFGGSPASIARVRAIGYDRWIDEQLEIEPSLIAPQLLEMGCSALQAEGEDCDFIDPHIALSKDLWWTHVVYGEDQLRQRVGFALSEILVVSYFNATLAEFPVLIAEYYDLLVQGSLGNFRTLLEDVTLHPAMGIYLSMLGNRKADPIVGTRPDENYARELMQLFTIGLVQLDAGGQPVLDEDGNTIPTYSQNDIEELSRVLTGWTWFSEETKTANLAEFQGLDPRFGNMEPWPAFHDAGAKTIVGGVEIPAGLSPEVDLGVALDVLFNHPNVGPFLGRQLIQRLVTSNPSPEYVARVAATFDDDGNGTRGNLAAVVRAILTDPEAIDPPADPTTFGKLREPLLRITSLWRGFDGAEPPALPVFEGADPQEWFGQEAMYSPSVFNFFSPFYSNSTLAAEGLVAPELQISTHATLTSAADALFESIHFGNAVVLDPQEWSLPVLDLEPARLVANDLNALLDLIEVRLLGSKLASESRSALIEYLEEIEFQGDEEPDGHYRATTALSLIAMSPDFIVQK